MAELVHGKASTYNNRKCRCVPCTAAWATYICEGGYVRRYQQKEREKRQAERQESVNRGTNALTDADRLVLESLGSDGAQALKEL